MLEWAVGCQGNWRVMNYNFYGLFINFLFICNKEISDELEIRRYELASQKGSYKIVLIYYVIYE